MTPGLADHIRKTTLSAQRQIEGGNDVDPWVWRIVVLILLLLLFVGAFL